MYYFLLKTCVLDILSVVCFFKHFAAALWRKQRNFDFQIFASCFYAEFRFWNLKWIDNKALALAECDQPRKVPLGKSKKSEEPHFSKTKTENRNRKVPLRKSKKSEEPHFSKTKTENRNRKVLLGKSKKYVEPHFSKTKTEIVFLIFFSVTR